MKQTLGHCLGVVEILSSLKLVPFYTVPGTSQDWSGLAVYFPKRREYEICKRDLESYQRFDGSNHIRLAHEFDLTERQVYTIDKQIR